MTDLGPGAHAQEPWGRMGQLCPCYVSTSWLQRALPLHVATEAAVFN